MNSHEFELMLPKPWIGRNVWERMHWGAKAGYMKFLEAQFRAQTKALQIQWPLVNVQIDGIRRNTRKLDRDNAIAGLKPYIDAMTQRHPKGIGLILDDTEDIVTRIEVEQVIIKNNEHGLMPGSTFIIYGVEQ